MRFATLPAVLLCLASLSVRAEDWPQWRGPDRSNVSKETGLLKSWPKGGPKLVWEAKGAGRGYSAVVVSKGKVVTFGDKLSADESDEFLTCYDDQNGKQLWKAKVSPKGYSSRSESWESPRSTPTIDGDHVYVISPAGVLACVTLADGKLVWKKDMAKDFGGNKGGGQNWGYSESPLVDGDKVVCTPGGNTATMLALNKKTGETIWKCPANNGAGHASIVISDIGGTRVYVNTTANKILGVRATDGKLLWSHAHPGSTAVIPTCIVKGDLVFWAAGYGKGGGLLKQIPGQDNTVTVEEVYKQNAKLTNKHGGILLLGNYLYGCAESSNNIYCADFQSGQEVWRERVGGRGSTSLTAADGLLYTHAEDGTISLIDPTPKKGGFKEISTFKGPGSAGRPSWAHPIISNGRLYVREGDKILCYNIKDSASSRR